MTEKADTPKSEYDKHKAAVSELMEWGRNLMVANTAQAEEIARLTNQLSRLQGDAQIVGGKEVSEAMSAPDLREALGETLAAIQALDLETDYYINGTRHPVIRDMLNKALAKGIAAYESKGKEVSEEAPESLSTLWDGNSLPLSPGEKFAYRGIAQTVWDAAQKSQAEEIARLQTEIVSLKEIIDSNPYRKMVLEHIASFPSGNLTDRLHEVDGAEIARLTGELSRLAAEEKK